MKIYKVYWYYTNPDKDDGTPIGREYYVEARDFMEAMKPAMNRWRHENEQPLFFNVECLENANVAVYNIIVSLVDDVFDESPGVFSINYYDKPSLEYLMRMLNRKDINWVNDLVAHNDIIKDSDDEIILR